MADTKITCPECGKVLRPAKPLPPGKRVKCPQCSALFVPGEDAEAPAAVSKTPAQSEAKAAGKTAAKSKPAKKPADDKPPKSRPAPRPSDDDEEDGPRTYEFIDDHRKEDEPEIDYVPDTSIKDLRGPAQEAVMGPSNWILRWSIGGFVNYTIFLIILIIPILFPVPLPVNADGTPATTKPEDDKNKEKKTGSLFMFYQKDLMDPTQTSVAEIIGYVCMCIVGMVYCGIVTFGAVKMQSLESRAWGMISSIMVMLPITSAGIFCVVSMIGTDAWDLFFSEDSVMLLLPFVSLGAYVPNLLIGVWGLVTLLKPEVGEGYDYIPEDARTERRRHD